MSREVIDVPLSGGTPGNRTAVRMLRYGAPEARPKAYIHAALHADEAPGLLVAHHLAEKLDQADARGEITGQIVLVPAANPLGLAQYINGDHLGRYDLPSGRNFNRNWPALGDDIVQRVGGRLTDDANANRAVIRAAIRELIDEHPQATPIDSLQAILSREAYDCDLVLDLHCDDEGLMHLFVHPEIWPEVRDLAAELGCHVVFSQARSGGSTFAEAGVEPWLRLAEAFPDCSIPIGCQAITLELRGFVDVGDEIARADASALINVLRRRRYLSGDADAAPEPLCELTGFDACDIVRTPQFGVVVYHAELGERVKCGQPIADIVSPPAAGSQERITLHAGTDGLVVTRRLKKLVAANQVIAKIAGVVPLKHRRGYLLED
ncbi:succinylglutamate desuccinylase/aspartoacylase family protein [Nitratireductor sp. GCM10026969]|uniref:succinylglutamate desuccinylase/aspartoacylase family protein n=1 Tax=Nitratireductor sp. GCM10026969 TaxID=3252645 RepID=UPI003610DFF7